jgi:hypothetical protein
MVKRLLVAAAALIASAQAHAEVLIDQTGLADFSVFIHAYGREPGFYKLTFQAPGAENAGLALRLLESRIGSYYENGQLISVDESDHIVETTPPGGVVTRSADSFIYEYEAPTFRDLRDVNLTGYYYDILSRVASAEFFTFLDDPVPYRLIIERFDSAPVPEPGSWALMIAGFGVAGAAARKMNKVARFHSASTVLGA